MVDLKLPAADPGVLSEIFAPEGTPVAAGDPLSAIDGRLTVPVAPISGSGPAGPGGDGQDLPARESGVLRVIRR